MRHFLQRASLWWLVFALWGGFLIYSSSREAIAPELIKTLGDKVIHLSYFAIGGTAFYLALMFSKKARSPLVVGVFTAVMLSVIGRLDELHQSFTPGRRGNDFGDWMADSAGGLLAVFVGSAIFFFLKRPSKA